MRIIFKLFEMSTNRPLVVLFLAALYTIVSAAGMPGLVQRSDYRAYVDVDYAPLVELKDIESIFSQNENVFLVIAPDEGSMFTPERLAIVQEVTAAAWLIPHAARADSITNFQHTEADGDDLVVTDLVPSDAPIDAAIVERASRVSGSEPSLINLLVSQPQDVAAVSINFQFSDDRPLNVQQSEVAAAMEPLLADLHTKYPDVRFMTAGSVVVDYLVGRYSNNVNDVLVPMMLGVMGLLLVFMYRSLWATLATAAIVVLTGVTTMGLFGWMKLEVDGVVAVSPIVIMTLAVADSVHIIAAALNEMRQGTPKKEAILLGLKSNLIPVFLTSLTTVLGVITFSFMDFPSLRKLGVVIALGVSVAFVLSVTVLPALLQLAPLKPSQRPEPKFSIFPIVRDFVLRFHKRIVIVAALVCVSLSSMVSVIVINESFSIVFDESVPEQQAVRFISAHLSGFESMDVAVLSDIPGDLNNPQVLQTLDAFATWAEAQPEVTHVTTITDTYKRLNQNMHGDDPEWYKLPDSRELAAQYLLLYEFSLPYGLDINNQVNADKSGTRLTLMMGGITSREVVELKYRVIDWFADNAPSLRAVPTGMMPLMSEIAYVHMIPSMMQGGIVAILMVSLVLFLALRSWRLGLLGMLANMVPILMGYGLWGAQVGTVNFSIMSVAGICLGVVVDFAVHFLSKYRLGLQQYGSVEAGVRFAFDKVARPLWITTIVLVTGFWVLATSDFNFVGHMGLLTGIIILIAFVFDLLVLPAILLTFGRWFAK